MSSCVQNTSRPTQRSRCHSSNHSTTASSVWWASSQTSTSRSQATSNVPPVRLSTCSTREPSCLIGNKPHIVKVSPTSVHRRWGFFFEHQHDLSVSYYISCFLFYYHFLSVINIDSLYSWLALQLHTT